MNQVFPLGIHSLWRELRDMPAGGIWWINTGTQEDTVMLINETLFAQASDARIAVLTSDNVIKNQLTLSQSGPEIVKLFKFNPTRAGFKTLQNDLLCSLPPEKYLFIIPCADEVWDLFSAPELRQWLQKINRWAHYYGCSFLIINCGPKSEKRTSLLINEYRGLNGLSTLQNLGGDYRLEVAFWCNDHGVSAQQCIDLDFVDGHLHQRTRDNMAPQPVNDSRQILSHVAVLEGAPALSEHWSLFEDNEALFNAARTAQAATIIFSLTQNNQIERLATMVHTLRRLRGSALKLVIREKNASLRAADERLLLGCGASLIVPWNSPLSRCLSLIESIQDLKYTRHVPEDIQILINAVQPLKSRGYLPWDKFCQAIGNMLANPLLPEDSRGVLVALRPVPGLKVEQVLTLCRPNRMGDIVTLGNHRLYLFLSFCRINDLDIALKHIFPLPVSDIISNSVVWFDDKQVAAQLSQMNASDPILPGQPLLDIPVQTKTDASQIDQIRRRIPQSITLLNDNIAGVTA